MEIPAQASNIRNISLALIKNPKGQFLYHQGKDLVTQQNFYRPLGGGIDFGELAEDTLRREMIEELNEPVIIKKYMGMLESIFTYEGKLGHEIVIVYLAEFTDISVYQRPSMVIHEHNGTSTAVWRTLEEIKLEGAHLYPNGLEELIKSL